MTIALSYSLKSRCVMPPAFFSLRMTLATCGSLQTLGLLFPFLQKKKAIGILKGIALNLLGTRDMNTTWYHSYLDTFLKIDLRNSEGKGRFPEAGHAEVGRGW